MVRKTKAEAAETRERLLDAALVVFRERGVDRPSLTEIAEHAGLTRGAVYVHFENKADLFCALLDRAKLPEETTAAWRPCNGTPRTRLTSLLTFILHETMTNPVWQAVLEIVFHRCEKLTGPPALLERFQRGRANSVELIARLVAESAARGELPADLDVYRTARFLHSALHGLMSHDLLYGDLHLDADAADLAATLITAVENAPTLRQR